MRAVLALLLLVSVQGCSSGANRGDRPKNLVFICVDTLRSDFLGAYGADPSNSPNLDAFAAESIVFDNAHSHASWTLPSFASVLTSLYSSTHGCWDFNSRLSADFETLVEVFQAAGFETHGVASHVYFNEEYGLQQGFDSFDDELAKKRTEGGWVQITSPKVTEKAESWLQAKSFDSNPFLLWVHYFDPHVPYLPHGAANLEEAQATPAIAAYKSEIRFTDEYVGRLLQTLKDEGHAEDTVVVFLSDHGEAFGEHPGIEKHSYSLYGEEIRIPLMMRVPGLAPRRVPGFVRNVDLRPTLLELFGLKPKNKYTTGVDLRGAMEGADHTSPALVSEIRLKQGHHTNALLDGRWKLIENVSRGGYELYDLEVDPGEQRDLVGERPEVVERLGKELRERIAVAEMLSRKFEGGGEPNLTPEEVEHLKEIGYGGD